MTGDGEIAHWVRRAHPLPPRKARARAARGTSRGRGLPPPWERLSRWKDRKKKVQFPLFPGYCFARLRYADRLRVLKAFGVVDLVGMNGQPEPIPEAEIEAVRTLVGSSLRYDPHPFLTEGMAVEVVRGPLMGVRGRPLTLADLWR